MASSLSVGQILHSQAKQKRELQEVRNELAEARDNEVLDGEIRRLNRSPYVGDRPYHKIQMIKGSQEELDWKKQEVEDLIEGYVEDSPRIDLKKLQYLRQREAQARAERIAQSSPEHNLKKLDII